MSRVAIVLLVCLVSASSLHAQRGRGGGGPAATAKQGAPIDLTGYWVSVITEDWKYRMVVPNKGVFDAVPLSPQGRKVADGWDAARDEAAGEQCRAYGAAAIMRMPGRLNITWQDDTTLKVDTDAGTQTRLLRFNTATPAPAAPSWQGHSLAQWVVGGAGTTRHGSLKAVTTNLRSGYIRKNGAPYSDRATVTEYWDLNTLANGDRWLTVTTKVEDPLYFTRPYVTSSDFKKLAGSTGWNPTPCSVR